MMCDNTFLLQELLTCETVCHHVLLTQVQLIVLRLTSINVGIVKMFIMTINVILPELETIVKVTNSSYSTVIQYLLRRGSRGEGVHLLLRYNMIKSAQ